MVDYNLFIYVPFAIVFIWTSTIIMLSKKRITPFLPFFVIGLSICFQSAMVFKEIYSLVFVSFAIQTLMIFWIFINIKIKGGKF